MKRILINIFMAVPLVAVGSLLLYLIYLYPYSLIGGCIAYWFCWAFVYFEEGKHKK